MELQNIGTTELTTSGINYNSLVDSFISAQDVRVTSRGTYKRTLSQFFNWVASNRLQLNSLSIADIVKYKEHLLSSGLSSLSVGSYITSVRKFYQYAEANKIYPNIAKDVKTPKRKQQFKKQALSVSQARELINHFSNKGAEGLRDYAIINLLLRGGLRTIELIRANIEDITYLKGERILKLQRKGRDDKDKFIILTDTTYKPIEEYLKTRGAYKVKEPLFISVANNNKGGRLTTRAISKIAKEGLRAVGIDNRSITAHSLRHTSACIMLSMGAPLHVVQEYLGHSNPATTQIYLESIAEENRLKEKAEALLDEAF